jgi:hypothetical protein
MSENLKWACILFTVVFLGTYLGTLCGNLHSANIQKDRAKYEMLDFIEHANKIIRER